MKSRGTVWLWCFIRNEVVGDDAHHGGWNRAVSASQSVPGAGQVREMSGVTVLTGPAIRAWKRQGCI